jgi:hypothetical protein
MNSVHVWCCDILERGMAVAAKCQYRSTHLFDASRPLAFMHIPKTGEARSARSLRRGRDSQEVRVEFRHSSGGSPPAPWRGRRDYAYRLPAPYGASWCWPAPSSDSFADFLTVPQARKPLIKTRSGGSRPARCVLRRFRRSRCRSRGPPAPLGGVATGRCTRGSRSR